MFEILAATSDGNSTAARTTTVECKDQAMKKYKIEDLGREDLLKLFEVALVGTNSIKHDIISPLGAIVNGAEIIKDFFSGHGNYDEAKENFTLAVNAADLIMKGAQALHNRVVNMDRFLPVKFDGKYQFIAMPHEIMSELIGSYDERKILITVDENSEDLPLVFPHCALYSLFYELVGNAVKHGASRIGVAWKTARGEFILTVEDDGPGITASLSDEYIRLEVIAKRFLFMEGKKESLGLRFILKILASIKGHAQVRRSQMSGSEIRVTLPILGIWHDSALPELRR